MQVFWVCDKQSCKSRNYRSINEREIIIEDVCDSCQKYIKEPITYITKNKNRKQNGKDTDNNK